MNDENEVCTSRGSELVYENIVLCVSVHKRMHVSIGLSEFHG